MKKILKLLTSRLVIVGLLIMIQIGMLLVGIFFLHGIKEVYIVLQILSLLVVLYLLSRADNPMFKLAWIIPILIFPIFGGLFYLFFGSGNMPPRIKRYLNRFRAQIEETVKDSTESSDKLKKENPTAYRMSRYIHNKAFAPVYEHTYSRFLSPGEENWTCIVEELKKAERYIFLEYFIIEDGIMWQSILTILKEKVAQGVTVKLLYDDLGSVMTLNSSFPHEMERLGIQTRVFNPFKPSLDVFMNHRDHRKILVIDGNVGFTGGINLADEYINGYEKHGYWKDAGVVLKGEAVWSLTILFLQLWQSKTLQENIDYNEFRPTEPYPTDGYVQPFGDSPLDEDLVGEMTYMNIINNAQRYVYISTPYLILDNEMTTALCSAAQSGIDVRIVTPHIADKWLVHFMTRANYPRLVRAGVKIYEFTPGFIHSKTIVADDQYAIVGTTNFDFRSFYLHFECGVFFYQTASVMQVYEDYQEILKESESISLEACMNVNPITRLLRAILTMFSPLM